ncbi:MAG: hypothetical protein ACI9KE_002424 [Polyangiales bacterium]|jgi:hypothetical protein
MRVSHPTAVLCLWLIALAGCYPAVGPCDESAARQVYLSDVAGEPAYGGQALINQSCGDGSFCHTSSASATDRFGTPRGLDFDLRLATSDEDTERLRADQLRTFRWRRAILRTQRSGSMPPGVQGAAVLGGSYAGLPSLDSDEGQEILRNWLACGAPVVERTSARGADVVPVGAIISRQGDCPTGQAECDGRCLSLQANANNCGACGVTCGAGQPCVDGACSTECSPPLVRCDGRCLSVTSDAEHCGGCGMACGAGTVCFDSACLAGGCPDETTDCGGSCVDTEASAAHCGSCGNECAGTGCEAGMCTCGDTTSDPFNCGACENQCPQRSECVASSCVCDAGTTLCDGACADVANDGANCGGCGVSCADGQVCRDGACGSCGEDVSFARDVRPIFNETCAGSLCHTQRRAAGDLELEADPYGSLVNVSASCGGRVLVVPGDPADSYLMSKLLGVGTCRGNSMPLRAPSLGPAQLAAIENWICGGALNN